jgi:DNA-binding MarR family transcriptional regulator/GNAT superfamily N-acetyltransferase
MTVAERVDTVRGFNRFYTNVIGVVGEGFLGTTFSLTEGRILYELGQQDVIEGADLRARIGLDPGYFSRILTRFEDEGLVRRRRSDTDGRRHIVGLTASGRKAFTRLDRRSTSEIAALLDRLSEEDQRRLTGAMEAIRELLDEEPRAAKGFVLRPLESGDYGWVVQRHGVLYADELGWVHTFEGMVARLVADYIDDFDPKRENAWIAEVDGERVGCIFCVKRDTSTAQLRMFLVEPSARGLGVGTRLVDECLRFARRARYTRIVLWTHDVSVAARRIYARAGFELIESEPHHDWGHDLLSETWAREL